MSGLTVLGVIGWLVLVLLMGAVLVTLHEVVHGDLFRARRSEFIPAPDLEAAAAQIEADLGPEFDRFADRVTGAY